MKDNKRLLVKHGPKDNQLTAIVVLNGVCTDEKLTPKMASRAAHVACGHRSQVIVWDEEYGHGYRLYQKSARKIHQSL